MRTVRTVLSTAVLVVAGFGVLPATPASAVVYCTNSIVWQDAFVPGEHSGSSSPNCVMAQGAGPNNAVGTLQGNLKDCHRKNIAVDRIFGTQTRNALIEVQRSLGITADGVYGPQTARAMSHGVVGGGSACKRITF